MPLEQYTSKRIIHPRNFYWEYRPGQQINFTLNTLEPDGTLTSQYQTARIKKDHGGGFAGKVLAFENLTYVLKTTLPESWHHFWRIVNSGPGPFPDQIDETSAQLTHLSTRLIHNSLQYLSEGKYYSPNSLGYTQLKTGFAQAVEKIEARGPRYDVSEDELRQFRQAQRELLDLGLRLGLEQVGQIHPDNPFGMANIWKDEKNSRWIWLDTIPAIPHNGWIWPLFYFKFHKDIRRYFNSKEPTFNKIHTDIFRSEITANKHLFPHDVFNNILADLELYNRLWQQQEVNKSEYGKERGSAVWALSYFTAIHAIPGLARIPIKALIEPLRTVVDSKFRIEKVLNPLEQASRRNLITQQEYDRAIQEVQISNLTPEETRRRTKVLSFLLAWYVGTGYLINVIEASAYFGPLFFNDRLTQGLIGFFIGEIFPSIFRPISTGVIGLLTHTDLKTAAVFSAAPKGLYGYAIPAQLASETAGRNNLLWHLFVRNGIANLTGLFPQGGWSSQSEGDWFKRIGKPFERLAKPKAKIE